MNNLRRRLSTKSTIVLKNIIGAFLIKGFSLVISMISLPLYINYFNNNIILGVWFTILSVLSWFLTFDFGLGNGLRNSLVVAIADKDKERIKQYISSTYVILGIISILGIIIAVLSFENFDFNSFFNIKDDEIPLAYLRRSVLIVFIGIIISLCLKIINSIIYALQKSAINNLIALITNIIPLIYILWTQKGTSCERLIHLSAVYVVALNIPLVIATIIVFSKGSLKGCFIRWGYVSWGIAKKMLQVGTQFFFAQITFMVITATNEIIISNFFAPSSVVDYQIYYKLFTVVGSVFMLALTPLWSSVTKAYVEKDYVWLKKINNVLYIISGVAALCEFAIIIILQYIVNIWLGDNAITINYFYASMFALFGSVFIFNVVLTTIANGIGYLKLQIICYGIGAVVKIPVICLISNFYVDWISTIIVNILILGVFCVFQLLWLNRFMKIGILMEGKNEF